MNRVCLKVSLLSVAVLFLFSLLPATQALAGHPAVANYHAGKIAEYQTGVSDLRTELASIPPEDWSDAHLAEYSTDVFWLMYHAYTAYVFRNDRIPDSPDELVSAGLITDIPGNPLRGWESVQVLDTWDGFSAGDLVIQTAPVSHYSLVGSFEDYDLRPLSFELAVYGPREDHFQGVAAAPAEGNTWASQPAGILVMAGVYCETADETLQKIEERMNALQNEGAEE